MHERKVKLIIQFMGFIMLYIIYKEIYKILFEGVSSKVCKFWLWEVKGTWRGGEN